MLVLQSLLESLFLPLSLMDLGLCCAPAYLAFHPEGLASLATAHPHALFWLGWDHRRQLALCIQQGPIGVTTPVPCSSHYKALPEEKTPKGS